MKTKLPDMIKNLPTIDAPSNIKGHLIQGESNQSIFFEIKAGTRFPEHTHAAQWGIVIEGEFEITVGDKKTVYKKGDTYFVPDNTPHSGYYITDVTSFDLFDDKGKFKPKTSE